jgi:hypothetical protein
MVCVDAEPRTRSVFARYAALQVGDLATLILLETR